MTSSACSVRLVFCSREILLLSWTLFGVARNAYLIVSLGQSSPRKFGGLHYTIPHLNGEAPQIQECKNFHATRSWAIESSSVMRNTVLKPLLVAGASFFMTGTIKFSFVIVHFLKFVRVSQLKYILFARLAVAITAFNSLQVRAVVHNLILARGKISFDGDPMGQKSGPHCIEWQLNHESVSNWAGVAEAFCPWK